MPEKQGSLETATIRHTAISAGDGFLRIENPRFLSKTFRIDSYLGHIIQGIAAGIGFIGAGTILKLSDRLEIKGLTTASSIWLAAAVGVAAGLQLYVLAVTGTLLALLVLAILGRMEKWFVESPPERQEK